MSRCQWTDPVTAVSKSIKHLARRWKLTKTRHLTVSLTTQQIHTCTYCIRPWYCMPSWTSMNTQRYSICNIIKHEGHPPFCRPRKSPANPVATSRLPPLKSSTNDSRLPLTRFNATITLWKERNVHVLDASPLDPIMGTAELNFNK